MRMEQLEYLLDVEKTRSITKTAENFSSSRQLVSSNIRALEEELGIQLLIRQQGNLQFTSKGKITVEKAYAIINAYRDLLQAVSGYVSEEHLPISSPISIYAIPRLASTIIPDVIARFRKIYPEVEFRIITQTSDEILKSITENENSIGFISYQDYVGDIMEPFQLAHHPNLTITPFLSAIFYLCMNKHSRYNTKAAFTVKDLADLPVISYAPAYSNLSNAPDIELNIVSDVNNLTTMASLIQQNLGVGLITLREFETFFASKNLVLKPFENSDKTIYHAYVLNDHSFKKPLISAFTALLADYRM